MFQLQSVWKADSDRTKSRSKISRTDNRYYHKVYPIYQLIIVDTNSLFDALCSFSSSFYFNQAVFYSFFLIWFIASWCLQFGALTPLEPRLGKKLIEPLTNLIHRFALFPFHSITFALLLNGLTNRKVVILILFYSTSAMSLLYECINTVIAVLISISSGMPNHTASIQLCVQKLRILIEDSDQNCMLIFFSYFPHELKQ